MTGQESDATQNPEYTRKVDVVKKPEQPRLFSLGRWAGFETISIDVAHCEPTEGKSSYNFIRKLSHVAADTIVHILISLNYVCCSWIFMAFTAFFMGYGFLRIIFYLTIP